MCSGDFEAVLTSLSDEFYRDGLGLGIVGVHLLAYRHEVERQKSLDARLHAMKTTPDQTALWMIHLWSKNPRLILSSAKVEEGAEEIVSASLLSSLALRWVTQLQAELTVMPTVLKLASVLRTSKSADAQRSMQAVVTVRRSFWLISSWLLRAVDADASVKNALLPMIDADSDTEESVYTHLLTEELFRVTLTREVWVLLLLIPGIVLPSKHRDLGLDCKLDLRQSVLLLLYAGLYWRLVPDDVALAATEVIFGALQDPGEDPDTPARNSDDDDDGFADPGTRGDGNAFDDGSTEFSQESAMITSALTSAIAQELWHVSQDSRTLHALLLPQSQTGSKESEDTFPFVPSNVRVLGRMVSERAEVPSSVSSLLCTLVCDFDICRWSSALRRALRHRSLPCLFLSVLLSLRHRVVGPADAEQETRAENPRLDLPLSLAVLSQGLTAEDTAMHDEATHTSLQTQMLLSTQLRTQAYIPVARAIKPLSARRDTLGKYREVKYHSTKRGHWRAPEYRPQTVTDSLLYQALTDGNLAIPILLSRQT